MPQRPQTKRKINPVNCDIPLVTTKYEREIITLAAEKENRSRSNFVRMVAVSAAQDVLAKHGVELPKEE